jgi:predicted MFS family arabinose efflux permease
MRSSTGTGRAWFILLVLFFARAAMAFQFQSIAAVGPLIVAEMAIDYAMLGALVGYYFMPGIVMAIPSGVLAQRFGDKRMVVLGLMLMALGGGSLAMSGAYPAAAAARLLSGVGAVLITVLLSKMVADWFEGREIITAMALLLSSWPIGITLSFVTLAPVAEVTSAAVASLVAASVCIMALVLVVAFYTPPPAAGVPLSPGTFQLLFSLREWALISVAGLIWMVVNGALIVLVTFVPVYLIRQGYSLAEAGSLAGLLTLVMIFSVPLGGALAERIQQPNAVMVSSFASTATIICLIPHLWHAATALILVGLLFGIPAGVIMKLPTEAVPASRRAVGMGVFFSINFAGMAAASPVAGALRDATGRVEVPIYFAGGLVLSATLLLALFRALQRGGSPRTV